MRLNVVDPLKRSWEKGIYMGRIQPTLMPSGAIGSRRRADILAVDDGARVGLAYFPGIYVNCWLSLPPLRKCRRDADRVVRIVERLPPCVVREFPIL